MNYDAVRNWRFADVEQTYTEKDTILYALGVGYGSDPLDEGQLRFVLENGLRAAPTMATTLGYSGFWQQDAATGIDWRKLVAGETVLEMHAALPVAATVVGRTRVTGVVDKGLDKGAIVYTERTVSEKSSGKLLATFHGSIFCRGDGGMERSDPSPPWTAAPSAVPQGAPDAVCDLPTVPQAALIYRLSGDRNPLHSEPAAARAVGFDRPILHGLATYGVVGHALLRTFCAYDPRRLASLSARFSSPVVPGETIRTEMWRRGSEVVCRSSSVERGVVVLSNCVAILRDI
ncbi:MAG: MaoC/PaaZ C-terminal domain-containing protein [Pseudomonadota bacterium]